MQKTSWTAIGIAIFSGMVAAAAIGKVPPALPVVRDELALSMIQAGWVMSVFSTLGGCGALFFGAASARIGQFRLALLGLATMALGALLGASAGSYELLLASRVLEGSGFIAVVVTLPTLITRSTAPRDCRLALGLWSTYLPFGSSVVMLSAPFLLPTLGWRGLWLALGAAALACATALYRLRHRFAAPVEAPGTPAASGVIGETLRRPAVWCLAAAFFTYALQWFTLMVWLPSFLVDQRGLSASLAGALTAAVVAANVPGNVFGGWLVHRGVSRGALIVGTSLLMLGCGFAIFDERLSDTLRYGLCLLFTVAGGALPAAAFSGMAVHAPSPRHIGAVNGMLVQGSNLGQLVGPPAVAAVVSAAGNWGAATTIMALAAAGGVLAGLLLVAIERKHREGGKHASAPAATACAATEGGRSAP